MEMNLTPVAMTRANLDNRVTRQDADLCMTDSGPCSHIETARGCRRIGVGSQGQDRRHQNRGGEGECMSEHLEFLLAKVGRLKFTQHIR